jgi:NADPH-dependent F420 reductase
MKIAIIGTGNVGKNLGEAFEKNNEVVYGSRDPESAKAKLNGKNVTTVEEAAKSADVIVLAVPYRAAKESIHEMKNNEKDKILIDVCNPLDEDLKWIKGFHESAAEEIAKHAKGAKVVKAFNTIFAENMRTGQLGNNKLTTFIAGDDEDAKGKVIELARGIGMEPVDVGALEKARYIEPAGLLLIELGYGKKLGTNIGINVVKESV